MKLEEIKSKAGLSKFIESYWHFDGRAVPGFTLLPDGTFNMIISTAGFSAGENSYPAGPYLLPIHLQPLKIMTPGRIFGIRFKAFSMITVAGKKVNSLRLINDLQDALEKPLNMRDFCATIRRHEEFETAWRLLEDLAFDLLNHRYYINENLRYQVNYLLDRKGDVRITDLCDHLGISRQALHKSFKSALGIGPKELAMTWRLNHFFTLMNSGGSLTATALDAGFFDQAHSINAFKAHWALSPSNFKKTEPGLFHYAMESMNKRFSNFYDPEV